MNKISESETVIIFTGTLWEANLISSILADVDINSFVRDSSMGTFLLDPIKVANCKVMILSKDQELAQEVVDSFFKNRN